MKAFICLVLCGFLLTTQSFALDKAQREQLKVFYKKAEKAISVGNMREADFWMARHMAIRTGSEGLWPLFKKRDLKPTAFISGKFSESFLEFFILSPTMFWDRPKGAFSEKLRSFAIIGSEGQGYYAYLYGSPALEDWSIIKEKPEQAVIPFIAYNPPPELRVGHLGKDKPSDSPIKYIIQTDEKYIQTVFPIEFVNLDGDKVPAIFLRYNVAWSDGFEQRLDILKIVGKKLMLLKRFSGECEGLARRLPDGKIEVGEGYPSKEGLGHLFYDRFRIETWEYKNKTFVKVGERTLKHILWTDEWQKYYFPESDGKN